MNTPRMMIAGTHSGVGKTSIATGLMKAFSAIGLHVQPFKIGPDYIDPGYHAIAAERSSCNLDTFLLPEETVIELFVRKAASAQLAIIEGVMGLFDGKQDNPNKTSSAYIAKLLKTPVILIVDASAMGHSIAALIKGYTTYDPQLNIVGIIANRVGSERHLQIIKEAVEEFCQLTFFGGIKRGALPKLDKRHLGLLPAWEQCELAKVTDGLGEVIAKSVDMKKILVKAAQAPPITFSLKNHVFVQDQHLKKVPIAIALDSSFNFYYQDSLDLLENKGATLIPFSPLRDKKIPEEAMGLLLGGGFPEVFAPDLTENQLMFSSIRDFADSGKPIYAECGGLMYLCEQLTDFNEKPYRMTGVIPATAVMTNEFKGLGYRIAKTIRNNVIAPIGTRLHGHEFHYSKLSYQNSLPWAYRIFPSEIKNGTKEGYAIGNILASYLHLHWAGHPIIATNFINRCNNFFAGVV